MAKSISPIISAISGNLGGVEFQHSRGAQVVKARRRRSAPSSPAVRAAQLRLAQAVKAWQALDADDRQTWYTARSINVDFGRLQGVRTPDAMALFIAAQHDPTYTTDKAVTTVAPSTTTSPPLTLTAALSVSGAYNVTTTGLIPGGLPRWQTISVARWLPSSPQPHPTTWNVVGTYDYFSSTFNWKSIFHGRHVAFCSGERVAIAIRWQFLRQWISPPCLTFATVYP
jgi:hypothetical protein